MLLSTGEQHTLSASTDGAQSYTIDLNDPRWQNCFTLHGARAPEPQVSLICGIFQCDQTAAIGVLSHLPPVLLFDAEQLAQAGLEHTIAALIEEAAADRQGSGALLHRLAEMIFIQLVRAWATDSAQGARGWLGGLRDPHIAASLSAFHAQPRQRWTVAALASCAVMSRSAFAARFTDLVGTAPLAYMTSWRMQTARRLLSDPRLSVMQVADQVGYTSEIAFAKGFNRAWGSTPAAYRRAYKGASDSAD